MSAQKVSAPARFSGLLAAVVLVALAAAVAVRLAGRREVPTPPAAEPPPEGRVVDLKERVRHEEYEAGRLVADIRGDAFSRGPDGRNHLTGSVEVTSFGRDGEVVSRLTADEIVYEPGSLRFTVRGKVRVEAGGVVLEGDAFDHDRALGLFGTTGGGVFSSRTMTGRAAEIAYADAAGELRLGGGFEARLAAPSRPGEAVVLTGDSLTYRRKERRGLVEGRAALVSDGFRSESAAASFAASSDESILESADLEGAAKIVFGRKEPPGEGRGEIRADRIALLFARDPFGLESIKTSGRSGLFLRSAADRTETVLAPTALLSFDRVNGLWTWSASGGIRAEITEAGGPGRALEGEEARFGSDRVVQVSGRPAVADSAETRIEAPRILVASAAGDILASGGVAGVLKKGEGRRTVGFFSRREDVAFSSERLEIRPESSVSLFSGNVLVRQGTDVIRAEEIEFAGDLGRMRGGGGIAVTLTEAAEGQAGARTIELGGREMTYLPDTRTLTLSSKAFVRLPEAGLEAERVSAVIGREAKSVDSLSAAAGVIVSKGRYVGRSEAASYQAAADRITLTGNPVLTDGKGGSARGDKLTFDLADDKILVENEGPGRSTTIVRS